MKDKKSIIFISDIYYSDGKHTFSIMDNQGNLENKFYWTDYQNVGQEYADKVGKIGNKNRGASLLTPDYLKDPQKIMWVFSNLYNALLKEVDKKHGNLEEKIKNLEEKISRLEEK